MKKLLQSLIPDTHPLRLWYHRLRSGITAWRWGFPARHLTVIGITGTDGKTTTVSMVAHILHSAGKRVGAVSTAFFEVDGQRKPNPTQKTSITSDQLQKFLHSLVQAGCQYAVIEVSSHGLMQGRLNGVTPQVAGITNVTMEHLDYHGTMKEYIRAKSLLFRKLNGKGAKVINADDVSFEILSKIPSEHTLPYSPSKQFSEIRADNNSVSASAMLGSQSIPLSLSIPGVFNLSNALCALHCCKALGIDFKQGADALRTFKSAPGRMERIDAGQPFDVYIDFTVTPVAYESTLSSLRRSMKPGSRLLVLTGSCGDRMPEKRPLVGEICSRLADIVVVTNEDPYTEDPEKIIDEVFAGIANGMKKFSSAESLPGELPAKFAARVSNRLTAIRFLLNQANPDDTVIFCGKGADITMMTANGQIPWNEREIVMRELQRKK